MDCFNFYRNVCAPYFIDNPIQISCSGAIVKIYECKFGKRKYNRRRYGVGHCVFGGIERGTNEAFIVEGADGSAAKLLPIIRQHIKIRKITVTSDEWRAYGRIKAIRMTHETVNHYSIKFVDLVSGVHTQNIECIW